MPSPRRPSQDELLQQLIDSTDDRAWKLAIGYILGDVISDNRQMEERMRKAERMYQYAIGGILLLAVIMVPIAIAIMQESS